CTSPGPELLRNGDFEQLDSGGWLVGWNKFDNNPDGQIVVAKTPRVSGEYALQWQIDAAGDGREDWVTQSLAAGLLSPGHRYELTGYDYVDQPGDVALNYIVRGEPGDTPDIGTAADAPVYPTVAGTYARFRYEIELPDGDAPARWDVYLHAIKFTGTA